MAKIFKKISIRLMPSNSDCLLNLVVALFASLFVVGLAIPLLHFGFVDEDSTCQLGTRAGLTLSQWVKVTGWELIALTLFVFVALALRMKSVVAACVIVADIVFSLAWAIVGIVILATNENNECVKQGKGMAVAAIVAIPCFAVRALYLVAFWGQDE